MRTILKGNLDNEVRAVNKLCNTSHPHIVQILRHGFLKADRTFYFFDMELCQTNLANYISGDTTDGLENWCILRKRENFAFHVFDILEQIVDGLIFIHGHQEVHRDLHPGNGESFFPPLTVVLLSSQSKLWKIADFGLTSEGTSNTLKTSRSGKGMPGYRAPELFHEVSPGYNNKADIWSLGCIMYELFTGKKAFPGNGDDATREYSVSRIGAEGLLLRAEGNSIQNLQNYIHLLERKPLGRPSIFELKVAFKADKELISRDVSKDPVHLVGLPKVIDFAHSSTSKRSVEANEDTCIPFLPSIGPGLLRGWVGTVHKDTSNKLKVSPLRNFEQNSIICSLNFDADGRFLVAGCENYARVFDVDNDATIAIFRVNKSEPQDRSFVRAVCFICKDRVALAVKGAIYVWNIDRKVLEKKLDGHDSEIESLAVSGNGDWLASGGDDCIVRVWDTCSWAIVHTLTFDVGGDSVFSVAFSPDAGLLAVGMTDGVIYIWNTVTASFVDQLEEHNCGVTSLAFSPSAKELVSGSTDTSLRIWQLSNVLSEAPEQSVPRTNPERSYCTKRLFGHTDIIHDAAICPEGIWVASGSMDNSLMFWNAVDGEKYLTIKFENSGLLAAHEHRD